MVCRVSVATCLGCSNCISFWFHPGGKRANLKQTQNAFCESILTNVACINLVQIQNVFYESILANVLITLYCQVLSNPGIEVGTPPENYSSQTKNSK